MFIRANIREPEDERLNGRAFPFAESEEADRTAAIVEQCVEQILEILRREEER